MDSARERILTATAALLAEGGRDAVSTRAVAAAAGVQAPAIYRRFGDMRGLLDAVATHGFTSYLNAKTQRQPSDDPVADLRHGWDQHIAFGLANPAVYTLMYGDPRPGGAPPAAEAGLAILATHVRRAAEAGRLRVPEEQAAQLLHAAGSGTTLALLATPADRRDPALADLAREAVIAAITTDTPPPAAPSPASAAVALRALLPHTDVLTANERDLLGEWLDRIASR